MRFVSELTSDIRFQMKYGFYFMYLFFSVIYIAVLFLCPREYGKTAASLIILTDPAMLGSFFIGGIWLLEKGEGLHSYLSVSPLRPLEYILSKAVSLAVISTVSADLIILIGLRAPVHYFLLSVSVFTGSMIFTVVGLIIASYARSVNHYLLLVSPLEMLVVLPPVFALFGMTHPVWSLTPGMAMWRIIGHCIGMSSGIQTPALSIILALWLIIIAAAACRRISQAMRMQGSDGSRKC